MEKTKTSTLHILLLFGALALALSLRMIRLGADPLSNSEAEIALEALSAARSESYVVGAFPALVGLTGLDFFIFNSGDFLARFWPAVFGALIVLVPFIFRERMGLVNATAVSFILAIAPEMVGPSRLIGTPMMAMVCLLLGLAFFYRRNPLFMGVFFALGLMSGPGFWFGALLLALSFIVSDVLFHTGHLFTSQVIEKKTRFWLIFSLSFGLAILVVGSGFFRSPQGLSGVFAGLVQFATGIFHPPSISVSLRLISIAAYAGGAAALGIWGLARGVIQQNKLDQFLAVWVVLGLLFFLVYPGSEPVYLPWVSLPLWFLAVRAFVSTWRFPEKSRLVVIGMGVLVVAASAFMLLALRALIRPGLTQAQQTNTFIALIGGAVLLVAVVLLINFGWGEKAALSGLFSGMAVVIVAGLMAVSVNSSSLSTDRSYELWSADQHRVTTEWLQLSIDRVLEWNRVRDNPVEIAIADFDQPAMRWALRNYGAVDFVPYLAPASQPGMLITDVQALPEISSAYRGQDLVWSNEVLWQEMTAYQFLEWSITRSAPTQEKRLILWVRTDLMPDEQFSP